jgi:hypothetical protein
MQNGECLPQSTTLCLATHAGNRLLSSQRIRGRQLFAKIAPNAWSIYVFLTSNAVVAHLTA